MKETNRREFPLVNRDYKLYFHLFQNPENIFYTYLHANNGAYTYSFDNYPEEEWEFYDTRKIEGNDDVLSSNTSEDQKISSQNAIVGYFSMIYPFIAILTICLIKIRKRRKQISI